VRPPRKTEEGAQKTMFKRERYKHEGEGIDPFPDRRPKKKTERMKEGDGKGDGRLRDLSEDVRASRLRMRAI